MDFNPRPAVIPRLVANSSIAILATQHPDAPVLQIFRVAGSILNELLAIPDILAWYSSCKDTHGNPHEAVRVLGFVHAMNSPHKQLIRQLLEMYRPINAHRAKVMMTIAQWALKAYGPRPTEEGKFAVWQERIDCILLLDWENADFRTITDVAAHMQQWSFQISADNARLLATTTHWRNLIPAQMQGVFDGSSIPTP